MKRIAVLLALLALAAGCSKGASPQASSAPSPTQKPLELYPLPKDPMALARRAGLVPEKKESLTFHVHSQLDVFKDGRPVLVPGGIGINIDDPGVQHGDVGGYPGYGGISGCDTPCISPLHTHDATGLIHTESATPKPNTFGEFLIEWGVTLPKTAKITVDGKPYTGDPAKIELTDRKHIVLRL